MVTFEQAKTAREFHYGECVRIVGTRGGVTEKIEHWRRNGEVKTWKTRSGWWRLPIKFGLKQYGYMDTHNAYQFHVASECPLLTNHTEAK